MSSAIWTEKYRPSTFEEIRGQKDIIEKIKAFVDSKNLPHLLFSGPAGVGKTTLSLVIARQLFGEDWRQNTLELNASVTPDTPILIKIKGKTKRTTFGVMASIYYKNKDDKYEKPNDLEILCLDKNYKSVFKRVSLISRHKVDTIAKIFYEGGSIKTSLNHSVLVLNEEGNLVSKQVSELKNGDFLVSFKEKIEGSINSLDLEEFRSQEQCFLTSGTYHNPRLTQNFEDFHLTAESSWMMGMYMAEGCVNFNKKGSSGQLIFSLNNPHEVPVINRLNDFFQEQFSLTGTKRLAASGFDRTKFSSIQLRVFNTQLAKFFAQNFYNSSKKSALTKKVPSQLFDASVKVKQAFLEGYTGDATGKWNIYLRYSSRSQDALIDVAWLGRTSGLETSYFGTEARIIWKNKRYSYIRSGLLPANLVSSLLGDGAGIKIKYKLRHQLYGKKSQRVQKETIRSILSEINSSKKEQLARLSKLVESGLYVVKITKIEPQKYDDFVYDVSVPGLENFWGGTTPVLLHNSDERGIDVVRVKVKDFARTKALGNAPFKLIYLDESDALTREAQQALRRTMENYTKTCRFILSANFSSKIIDPIQSRCAVFRFKPLAQEDIYALIKKIAKEEGLKIDEEAMKALFDVCEGDGRRLENILQSCAVLKKEVDAELVYSMASVAKPKEINELLSLAAKGNFLDSRKKLLDLMLDYGMSGLDVIKQIQKEIWNLKLTDRQKVEMIDKCGEVEFRMVEGADEYVQLESFLAFVTMVGTR